MLLKDILIVSFTVLYFAIVAILYLTDRSSDYTEAGRYTTVLTHLAAIPVLLEVRKKRYLALYIFGVVVVSSIYHLSQVGWWWSVPEDNPWRRLDHGFSTLLLFVISVTLWYDKIPWSWVLLVSFTIMGVSAAFMHTKLAGLQLNTWIGGAIAIINVLFVFYESFSKDARPKRNIAFLWTAIALFGVAIFFYLYPIRQQWNWFFHSAWHVAVFTTAYLIIRSEETPNNMPNNRDTVEKEPLIQFKRRSTAPLRF